MGAVTSDHSQPRSSSTDDQGEETTEGLSSDGCDGPRQPPDTATSAERARAVGRGLGTSARVTGRVTGQAVRGVARGTGRASLYTVRQARRAADAEGAKQSGLNRLIHLHSTNAAGDTAVAISLAGTLFFAGATSEARSQVALFLGLTMLPFAIVAPLIGPFLDRFSHGRRWAIGSTFAIRAFLCWVLASAVASESALFYPAALGVLVSSKAYGVTRAAAVPRLLPQDVELVKANGRVSLAGIVGAGLSAPIAGAIAVFGGEAWSLRFAFLVFVLGTVASIRLPDKVDSSAGEQSMSMRLEDPQQPQRPERPGRTSRTGRTGTRIPGAVAFALRANCGPRFLSGFLTMFMAFLLRENPIDGWEDRPELLLGVVIGAAGLGNTLAILSASVLKQINPSVMVVVALLADGAAVLFAALFYGLIPLAVLGLTAGLSQSLAKLSLDSTIQAEVPPQVQASAFARSDTTLQLAWVIGGFVGIALPLIPRLGLGVAVAVLAVWTFFVISSRPRTRRNRPVPFPV